MTSSPTPQPANGPATAAPLTAEAEQEIRQLLDRPHYTFLPSDVRSLLASLDEARKDSKRLADLETLINTPELADFMKGVPLEAIHQRERWGDQHDKDKTGADWIFLFGFLGGKAVQAKKHGDIEKAQHHAITAAAVMANFHRCCLAAMSKGGTQ